MTLSSNCSKSKSNHSTSIPLPSEEGILVRICDEDRATRSCRRLPTIHTITTTTTRRHLPFRSRLPPGDPFSYEEPPRGRVPWEMGPIDPIDPIPITATPPPALPSNRESFSAWAAEMACPTPPVAVGHRLRQIEPFFPSTSPRAPFPLNPCRPFPVFCSLVVKPLRLPHRYAPVHLPPCAASRAITANAATKAAPFLIAPVPKTIGMLPRCIPFTRSSPLRPSAEIPAVACALVGGRSGAGASWVENHLPVLVLVAVAFAVAPPAICPSRTP